jgi:hypothetical protein
MKVNVYDLKSYLAPKLDSESSIVRFETVAIVDCENGVLILDNECCGGIVRKERLDFMLKVPFLNFDGICMSYNELPTFQITLQEIISNCECEVMEIEDFVDNPHKRRIQDNIDDAKRLIRKLNKEN